VSFQSLGVGDGDILWRRKRSSTLLAILGIRRIMSLTLIISCVRNYRKEMNKEIQTIQIN